MIFESLLFEKAGDRVREPPPPQPDFFTDLNLDQIVASITAGREEYNLTPLLYQPLHDASAVAYRHEAMQDLERADIFAAIETFARGLRKARSDLAQLEKRYYEQQKRRWFLSAVNSYVDVVSQLARDLSVAKAVSRGLRAFQSYLAEYVAAEPFAALTAEARQLERDLSAIRYSIHIQGLRVTVRHYEGYPDYGAEVEEAFARFQQGAVEDYSFHFDDTAEMTAVESQVLDGVVRLHPEPFSRLEAFCTANKDFQDPLVTAFDREVQFYVAYLKYIAPLKKAGLSFCYPAVSRSEKDSYDYQGFDLALASKLVSANATPVCNDVYLNTPERIIVVSGPNQGGKTTFARTFGQLHYLASLGYCVPGVKAQLFLADRIFAHFEREEHMTSHRGKLEDDLVRIHAILEAATPRSIIIINEIFASTTLQDAIFLSHKIAAEIIALDALCVWVTFIDELSSIGGKTVSMVSTVVPDYPAQRTFKIVRKPADGLAYAMSLARKYRLTYDMIMERTPS